MAGRDEAGNYILNGRRLAEMESNIKEARDAALGAKSAVEKMAAENAIWHDHVCRPHSAQIEKLDARVDEAHSRLDKSGRMAMVMTVGIAQVVSAMVAWITYFKFIKG